jgi:hypothetical protein
LTAVDLDLLSGASQYDVDRNVGLPCRHLGTGRLADLDLDLDLSWTFELVAATGEWALEDQGLGGRVDGGASCGHTVLIAPAVSVLVVAAGGVVVFAVFMSAVIARGASREGAKATSETGVRTPVDPVPPASRSWDALQARNGRANWRIGWRCAFRREAIGSLA